MGLRIGATWRIRQIDLRSGGDVGGRYHYCNNLLVKGHFIVSVCDCFQLDLVAESAQLHQDVDDMASHLVRAMPEAAAVGRNSTSGCVDDELPVKRGATIEKPPRRNRPRARRDGSCVERETRTQNRRGGRHSDSKNASSIHDDDNKENVCDLGGVRSDGLTSQRQVVTSSSSPPIRPYNDLVYRQCLGSLIASYLSPLRGQEVRDGFHCVTNNINQLYMP